jgi:hypothetical protein
MKKKPIPLTRHKANRKAAAFLRLVARTVEAGRVTATVESDAIIEHSGLELFSVDFPFRSVKPVGTRYEISLVMFRNPKGKENWKR